MVLTGWDGADSLRRCCGPKKSRLRVLGLEGAIRTCSSFLLFVWIFLLNN
jgi:hypothetical protein